MSTVTERNTRLLAITEAGVSAWLDQIRRAMVGGADLAHAVRALTDRITTILEGS